MLDNDLDRARVAPTLEGGRYVVYGVLGKGGNAGVYQAWDTTLRTWRAIKVLSFEFIKDQEVRARFAQEAATMARLDHPNLVQVYDISDDPFTPHIVMELCAGGSMIDWMRVHGAVPPRLAAQVIADTARGVDAAHVDGVVHRDIKPQNILIDHKGGIKLTDFGIAREVDSSLTMSGATIGTYAFMSPEQRHDSTSVDLRADIYSLGATLFTLVQVKTTTDLFVAERDDEIFAGMPEPILDVVLKACAYRPRDRFQSVAELIDALEAARAALPPDRDHPPLQSLARPLPDGPPDALPDLAALEGLLKSLALHDDTPTYSTREHRPDRLEHTTLGSSSGTPAERKVLPYYMPSHETTGSRGARQNPALRRDVPSEGVPSYLDPEDVTPEPPPAREEVAEVAAAEAEAEPSPWDGALRVGGPIVVVVLLLLSAIVGGASWGAIGVGDARTQAIKADRALIAAVERSAPALATLQAAGGDVELLRQAWFAANDAAPGAKAAPSLDYARRVRAVRASLPPEPNGAAMLDELDHALRARDEAYAAWGDAAGGPLGAMGVAFGLAQPPP